MAMKKRIHTYWTWLASLLLTAVLLPSCEKETFQATFPNAEFNTLSLKLFCSENKLSRTSPDDTNNENAIHRLDIFLYSNAADFNTPAIYSTTLDNIVAKESHTVDIKLDNTTVDNLFGSGTTCKIYVIANRPDATQLVENKKYKVRELKGLQIAAAFNSNQPQSDFVMDSKFDDNDVVELDASTHALSGEVHLYRAASKISLVVTEVKNVPLTDADGNPVYEINEDGSFRIEKNGDESPIMWEANTDGMYVRLHDGVMRSTIDNTEVPYSIQNTDSQKDYFSFASGSEIQMNATATNVWEHSPAFYSYSSDWGKAQNPDEEPYLTLIVPWARSDEKNDDGNPYYQRTYYQVPISTIAKSLARNTHYKINLVVSRLGSFVEETPTAISPSSYIIVPWQSESVNADLMDYRYLMVEEKEITIYNENELYIPYATSHEAEIVSVTCKQMDLSLQIPDWKDATYDALNLTQKEGFIYFKNELDNNYKSTTFDFSPYRITFTIRHKDEKGRDKYLERVTINQYPAIYGEAETNSDYGDGNNNGNGGYMFVNGYNDATNTNSSTSNATKFLSTNGLTQSWASPNMYVFTVTSIEGTSYVIGDPRETTVTYDGTDQIKKQQFNNQGQVTGTSTTAVVWTQGPVLYNGTVYSSNSNNSEARRTIKNYYGTENSDRTKNMIAPKFRIASGYAVLGTGNNNDSRYLEALNMRCASYQEDGYPAGRWRLPTKAEFEFILYQTNKGRLPDIYKDETTYWCAHGAGTVNGNTVNLNPVTYVTNGYSTRCVYDEWYWTDKLNDSQKTIFTWGDQPR